MPKIKTILLLASITALTTACATPKKETADDIREKTANATAELKENTKAVVEGVKEGLHRNDVVDLNKSSKVELTSLPGMTSERADAVIAARPYESPHQMVSRHAVSEEEYQRIKERVTVSK